jgi:hypothetical protein
MASISLFAVRYNHRLTKRSGRKMFGDDTSNER